MTTETSSDRYETMAVTVRAIATNQLTRSNTRRILMREIRVAVLNGLDHARALGRPEDKLAQLRA